MNKYFLSQLNEAFSLVEVTLALGIASFCLVTVFGLVPVGINTNRENVNQTTAVHLSSAITADLHGACNTAATITTPFYNIAVAAQGKPAQTTSIFLNADGSSSTTAYAGTYGTFRATVTVTPPASGRTASSARLWITWPGAADPDKTVLPSHYSGSFSTVVGLDRN